MSALELLDALDEKVRGGARAKLNLLPRSPKSLAAVAREIGDVAELGWGVHDGQALPVKARKTIQGEPAKPKLHWLPGDFRWLPIDEAFVLATSRFQRFADSKLGRDANGKLVRIPWASTNSFGAGMWIELASGQVVFRDREDYGPGRPLARDLAHFFAQYTSLLNADRLTWDVKGKRISFGRKALLYAFNPKAA